MFRLIVLLMVATALCEAKLRSSTVRLGTSPGLTVRLTRRALDSLFKNTANLASQYASKVPIPDVNATVSGVDIQTTRTKVTKFSPPVITYKLTAPNKIFGQLHLPTIEFAGPFSAQRRVFVATQKDTGNVTFTFNDAIVNFTANIADFSNSGQAVSNFKCATSLGTANLHVGGAKEKFATEVLALAAKAVRPAYNTQVCAVSQKLVANHLNTLLAKIPSVIDVNKAVSLKFQVKPVVAANYIELQLFTKIITDQVTPHLPAPFQEINNGNAMTVILISDAPINDGFSQAFLNGLLQATINKNSPQAIYDLLRFNSDQENSLGKVAPVLAKKYGSDADVEGTLKAIKAPEITFSKDKATFTVAIAADLYVTTKNDSQRYHEGGASFDVTGSAKITVVNGTLYAKASVDNLSIHIDTPDGKEWEQKLAATVHDVVEQTINNNILKKGVDLHLPFRIDVQQPSISFQQHTLQIQAGFTYNAKV